MKAEVKNLYQEFIDHIDFPTLVYIYETGRVIADNKKARSILGLKGYNLNKLWDKENRLKIERLRLENESTIFYNQRINNELNICNQIDIEVNSIVLDKQHVCVCFFDYSYKQIFTRNMSLLLPRIYWRDRKLCYRGINEATLIDYKHQIKPNCGMTGSDILDEETMKRIVEDNTTVINEKAPIFGVMQYLKTPDAINHFCNIQRIPIINRNGTVNGILISYQIIFSREEYKNMFDQKLRENNILSNVLLRREITILSCTRKNKNEYPINFISGNICKFGYQADDLYSGHLKFNQIVYTEDYYRVLFLLEEMEEHNIGYKQSNVRIRDNMGNSIDLSIEITMNRDCLKQVTYEIVVEKQSK